MRWRSDLDALGQGRVYMRASEPCTVYEADNPEGENATLVAMFEGETRVSINQPFVQVLTEGDVWWFDPSVNQTANKSTDVVYTTLDRPAALSPEMLAIQQLVRKNEIEREQMRHDMERLIDDRSNRLPTAKGKHRPSKGDKSAANADETPKVRDETVGVSDDAKQSPGAADSALPGATARGQEDDKRKAAGNKNDA